MYCSPQALPSFTRFENLPVELARKGSLLGVSSPGEGLAYHNEASISHHLVPTQLQCDVSVNVLIKFIHGQ
jgi:hypothetical protein